MPAPLSAHSVPPAALSANDVACQLALAPVAPADSFMLHAPLELMARQRLISFMGPEDPAPARARIAAIASQWLDHGPGLPVPPQAAATPDQAWAALTGALKTGDIDGADQAYCDLARLLPLEDLRRGLAGPLLPHLGAAGHAPILLAEWPRAAKHLDDVRLLARFAVRDMAAHPDWVLRWVAQPARAVAAPMPLLAALNQGAAAALPTNFIAPTMLWAEGPGDAAAALAGVDAMGIEDAARLMLRLAAQSMLQDDPAHAPYGWSHALTMPQAVLALAPLLPDPRPALRVAATFLYGFRRTLSAGPVDPAKPAPADGPQSLADPRIAPLAAYAGGHEDTHLAKYVLATFDAATNDPAAAALFLGAGLHLARAWGYPA